jgi:hypothetical protein
VGLLRDDAAAFTREILEDDDGFSQAIDVWNPAGEKLSLKGFAKYVGQTLDPGTGLLVSGMASSVTLPLGALVDGGFEMPMGELDQRKAVWVVEFANADGKAMRFKVKQTHPDRTLGVVVCQLEHWAG